MFIGRQTELAEVVTRLGSPGVVTVRGAPGSGKTALAARAAAALEERGGRVVRVALSGIEDPASAALRVVQAAGGSAPGAALPEALATAAALLAEPRTVVWLDGLDTPAGTEIVVGLTTLGDCTCLVTALSALGIPGECVIPLGPLPVTEAASLLGERVQRAGGELSAEDALSLVDRASGLPLVLELLAPQVAAVGPSATLRALRRDGLDAGLLSRAFARAQARLTPVDRDALGALSTFCGAFSAEQAEAVIGGLRPREPLHALCGASWVVRVGPESFCLLPSVRDFARTLAGPTASARHAAAVVAFLPSTDDEAALARLVDFRDDLQAAWRWAVTVDQGPELGRLALALDLVYVRTGPLTEHLAMVESTLASPSLSSVEQQRLHIAVGRSHALRGRHRLALASYGRVRDLLPDPDAQSRSAATCAALIGFSLRALGRLEEARAETQRAARCGAGELDRLAAAEMTLGLIEQSDRNPLAALAAFERAASLSRLASAPRMEGLVFANLALLHLEAGAMEPADEAVQRAQACLERAADPYQLARVEQMLGRVRCLQGRLDEAETHLSIAAAAASRQGDIEFDLLARQGLVELALARGQGALARSRLLELRALARVVEDVSWPARIDALSAQVEGCPNPQVVLRIENEGRLIRLDQKTLDFGRRGPLRRVLLTLGRARRRGVTLSAAQLLEAGWPGERMMPSSGAARVYMAVRRLRELGLEGTLLTLEEGYTLAPHCRVEGPDVEP